MTAEIVSVNCAARKNNLTFVLPRQLELGKQKPCLISNLLLQYECWTNRAVLLLTVNQTGLNATRADLWTAGDALLLPSSGRTWNTVLENNISDSTVYSWVSELD